MLTISDDLNSPPTHCIQTHLTRFLRTHYALCATRVIFSVSVYFKFIHQSNSSTQITNWFLVRIIMSMNESG